MAWTWPEVALDTAGRLTGGLTSKVKSIVAVGKGEGASRRGAEAASLWEGMVRERLPQERHPRDDATPPPQLCRRPPLCAERNYAFRPSQRRGGWRFIASLAECRWSRSEFGGHVARMGTATADAGFWRSDARGHHMEPFPSKIHILATSQPRSPQPRGPSPLLCSCASARRRPESPYGSRH